MRIKNTHQDDLKSYTYCRQITKRASSNFYLASRLFRRRVRRDIWAIYAFCRRADDIADAAKLSNHYKRQQLDRFFKILTTEQYPPDDLLWPAFFNVIHRYNIPKAYFFDLLKGIQMDIGVVRIKSQAELVNYSYLVAGTVGLMCAYILGFRDLQALDGAKKLGLAMQVTNILRDIYPDRLQNRVYLPADLLKSHGLSANDLISVDVFKQPGFNLLVADLADLAFDYYHESEPAIKFLDPANQKPVRVALNLYRAMLNKLAHDNDNGYNKRVRLNLLAKLFIVLIS